MILLNILDSFVFFEQHKIFYVTNRVIIFFIIILNLKTIRTLRLKTIRTLYVLHNYYNVYYWKLLIISFKNNII